MVSAVSAEVLPVVEVEIISLVLDKLRISLDF
jgi:hypothetical protein